MVKKCNEVKRLNESSDKKNKLTAELLALFLGFIGVHNLYLRQIKKAILQISLIVPNPFLIYLAIYLGLGVAHSTTNIGVAILALFILAMSIVAILAGCILWISDVIRIFTGNYTIQKQEKK